MYDCAVQASTLFELPDGRTIDIGAEISSVLAPGAFAPVAEGDENAVLPGADSLAALIANAISESELNLETKKELCVLRDRAWPCALGYAGRFSPPHCISRIIVRWLTN